MVLQRLSHKSRERRRAEKQYEQLLKKPFHRLLNTLIEHGLKANATAIAFGFHHDDDAARQIASPGSSPEELQEMRKCFDENAPKFPPGQRHAHIHGPYGGYLLPVWYLRDGALHGLQSIPFPVYFTILQEHTSRLVSIDGTPNFPQPCRYIELSPAGTQRCFVEVDFEWTLEDLFMIHLRSTQTPPPNANISQEAF